LNVTRPSQLLTKGGDYGCASIAREAVQPANHRDLPLLGGPRERPPDHYAAEKCDEITPPHAPPLRCTRRSEDQMPHPSAKAIAALQSAEAHDRAGEQGRPERSLRPLWVHWIE